MQLGSQAIDTKDPESARFAKTFCEINEENQPTNLRLVRAARPHGIAYRGRMKPSLSLDDRLDRVAQHIIRARLFLDLWLYYEQADTRPHILETMRGYNEFFRFTPHAYLVAYVIYVAGVFDTRRGTISLTHLVPEVIASGQSSESVVANVVSLMAQAKVIGDKVRTLRHRAFAHKDAHISYDDVFRLAAVTPVQLRELTEIALQITNLLLLARGKRNQYFTELPRQAAERMMQALSEPSAKG